MRRVLWALLALSFTSLGWGCAKASVSSAPTSGGRTVSSPPSSASLGGRSGPSPELSATAPHQLVEWAEAARAEQWDEVARIVDRLDPVAQSAGGLRYVRARAALRLRDHGRAARLLDHLEADLPALSVEIARDRAAALLEVGPYDEAARYYSGRGTAEALALAALAWERAGEFERALASSSRALELGSRSRQVQADARVVRARVAEKLGRQLIALADWRWLAKVVPTTTAADEAARRLESSAPLSAEERYERALAFARAGEVDRAEAELETKAVGRPIPAAKAFHVRGWARYMARTDHARAADWLQKAARSGGEDAVRDLFYAARARTRAHEDEQAVGLYLKLATRYPKTPFAEEARYLAARIMVMLGQWEKASKAYTSYIGRYGRGGRFSEAARYERAIAWLAGGKGSQSVKALRELLAEADSSTSRASLRELYAVALLTAGQHDAARRELRRVIEEAPLSFAALLSARRLVALGEPKPIPIEPPTAAAQCPTIGVELPPKVRLLHELGLDADAERTLTEHEPELRRQYGGRADQAICEAYGLLASGARRLSAGRRAVKSGDLDQAPSRETRWLWDCMYPRPYPALVKAAETELALLPGLVYALMRQESAFRPQAESEARASGLMQLLPATATRAAAELGLAGATIELNHPPFNIRVGAFYLARLSQRFQKNLALAIAAYNAGPQSVAHWLEAGEKLPLDLFVARIPFYETRTYVHRVIGNLARYAYLDGGPAALPELSLELPQGIRPSPDDY